MMSVKRMIDLYLTYGLDERTWNMLYNMACHDLISRVNWSKFFETCKGWQFSDSGNEIIDGDGTILYYYDDNGNLVKAV